MLGTPAHSHTAQTSQADKEQLERELAAARKAAADVMALREQHALELQVGGASWKASAPRLLCSLKAWGEWARVECAPVHSLSLMML